MAAKKRGRPAKNEGEGLVPITILIPVATKNDLEQQAQADKRPLSAVARARLERPEAMGDPDESISSSAAALGRLVALLADALTGYSPPGQEADHLRQGISRIVAKLYPAAKKIPEPDNEAEMLADLWLLRLHNSAERVYEGGKAMPLSGQQRALAEIWKQLAPTAARNRKEPK